MFTKTRRECIPVGSANMSVSRTFSDRRRDTYVAIAKIAESTVCILSPTGSSDRGATTRLESASSIAPL